MTTGLPTNIQNTFHELYDIISAFSHDQYNQVPFEGSWTGGQVVEHILKSLDGIPVLMHNAEPLAGRVPNEKVKAIEDLFLDFSIRMQAPEFIIPTSTHHNREDQLPQLKDKEKQLEQALQQDLSWVCMGFEFPGFGYFTRMEWVHFFLVHTQRHTRQLKNILNTIKQ